MDNSIKIFLIAASVSVSCLLAGMWMSITQKAEKYADRTFMSIETMQDKKTERVLTRYDGEELYGYQMINHIYSVLSLDSCVNLFIENNSTEGSKVRHKYSDSGALDKCFDSDSDEYVVPSDRYKCFVYRNYNDVITDICFVKV